MGDAFMAKRDSRKFEYVHAFCQDSNPFTVTFPDDVYISKAKAIVTTYCATYGHTYIYSNTGEELAGYDVNAAGYHAPALTIVDEHTLKWSLGSFGFSSYPYVSVILVF